jgi:hypothetical protein
MADDNVNSGGTAHLPNFGFPMHVGLERQSKTCQICIFKEDMRMQFDGVLCGRFIA